MLDALRELREHFRANPLSWLVAVLLLCLQVVMVYFLWHKNVEMQEEMLIHDQQQHLELTAREVEQRLQLALSDLRVLAARHGELARRGQESALTEVLQNFCRARADVLALQVQSATLAMPLVVSCHPEGDELELPLPPLGVSEPTGFAPLPNEDFALPEQRIRLQWRTPGGEWQLVYRLAGRGLVRDHGAPARLLLIRDGADWIEFSRPQVLRPLRVAWGSLDAGYPEVTDAGLVLFQPLRLRDPADRSLLASWRLAAWVPERVFAGFMRDFLTDLGLLALIFALVLAALYFYSRRIIGEQIRMVSELQRKQLFLDTLLDSSPDAMVTIELDGRIVSFNAPTAQMFGYLADELAGGSVELLLPSDYQTEDQDYHALHAQLADQETPWMRCERVGIRAHGEAFPVEVTYSLLRSDDQPRLLLMVREITERKVAQQELDSLRDQYFQQEKMAQIGLLMAGILHEVGNPLSAIEGLLGEVIWADEAGDSPMLDEQARANLQLVLEQTARIRAICQEVSGFATPRAHGRGLLSLNQILASTATLLGYDKRWRNIELELDLDPNLPAMVGVADQLTQVFMNLLVNAGDAINERRPESPKVVLTTRRLADDLILASVRDNGCGIPEETMRHIFENFYTTKPRGKGTGLGLSICEKLVEEHGGTIEFESRVGEGTEVRLYFWIDRRETED